MNNYLNKGALIGVEGRLEVYRVANDGDYQTRTNVNVSNVTFLESKNSGNRTQETKSFNNDVESTNNQATQSAPAAETNSVDVDEIDFDEIKF